ncbi:M56 family metallopeptidase [Marinisporobacter balticus]|uniref:Beta-lactamase regulating signal transducer with metallopeptidase domain n=1 Tax=Marinisporobacter balticus TaxID=2018667 RepID=A0A4R2KET5_9FIRM|nr:M56 family metallopeptidase [Marinisporobacter balticus]TCO72161.1 beta-lactamase regulating signal transducer with metallopeptidase domain [Marinisporobacter balticus]
MIPLFIKIFNMSFSAGIVALAVMLVRMPLKKAPKIYSYVIWVVVLFRLICPFGIYSRLSLLFTSEYVLPPDILYTVNPKITSNIPILDNIANMAITNVLPADSMENSINPIQSVLEIVSFIWFLGVAVLLLYGVIEYIRLKRNVYYATLVEGNIYETDNIKTPFVLGFIHPKIFIPTTLESTQYDYIIKHEQIHIMRRDYLIKLFSFMVLAIHWLNPLIWVSYFLMSKDMEMSCDEAVLRKEEEDIRKDYSLSLLDLSTKRTGIMNPIAFGESDVKWRIKNVINFKKHAPWINIASILIVMFFLTGFISNRTPYPYLVICEEELADPAMMFVDGAFYSDTGETIETLPEDGWEHIGNIVRTVPQSILKVEEEFVSNTLESGVEVYGNDFDTIHKYVALTDGCFMLYERIFESVRLEIKKGPEGDMPYSFVGTLLEDGTLGKKGDTVEVVCTDNIEIVGFGNLTVGQEVWVDYTDIMKNAGHPQIKVVSMAIPPAGFVESYEKGE